MLINGYVSFIFAFFPVVPDGMTFGFIIHLHFLSYIIEGRNALHSSLPYSIICSIAVVGYCHHCGLE